MPRCLKMYPLRALKSPQKFRTQGCSSANFLGSRYISDLKTWSLNCLTALTYDDGFFSWLSSYEIKRLERTIIWIPCKNRGENGALFQKIFFYSLLLLLSDTMERQNLMMSPSKFLFKKEKSQNWFACFELFKLAAAVLLLQNIIWILVQVLPRALSTKTKPLREWEEERSESTVICMPIQHFNDTWVQHFWKIHFYDMAKGKNKERRKSPSQMMLQ